MKATARLLWPDFDTLVDIDRARLLQELLYTVVSLPLALLSLVWLFAVSDWLLLATRWPTLVLFLASSLVLSNLSFFQVARSETGQHGQNMSSLASVVIVSGALLFGPTAIWIVVINHLLDYTLRWNQLRSRIQTWNWIRNFVFNLWADPIALLLMLGVYTRLGGEIPLAAWTPRAAWPAFLAVLALILIWSLFFAFLFVLWARLRPHFPEYLTRDAGGLVRSTALFFLISNIPAFFGILGALVFSQMGLGVFLFFVAGVLLVSLLARQMSWAAQRSFQRSREVDLLERLGREIIAGPADVSTLPQLLAEYLPQMFDFHQVEIRLFSGQCLARLPEEQEPLPDALWDWIRADPEPTAFEPGEILPWSGQRASNGIVVAPILAVEQGTPLGAVVLVQEFMYALDVSNALQPALQAVAAQIASAQHSAQIYRKTLAHQQVAQELAFAGQIQASFLPASLPQLPGWQLAATLRPALETSGDFYDAFLLPNGRLGLLVADVADKGMGAALYMALSRTLLRTYAYEYHDRPDFALRVANRRILADSQAGLFVTVFYAIVDPIAGTLTYSNAGHNPPLLIAGHDNPTITSLGRTGMVLGVDEDQDWTQAQLSFGPGDTLVLYSDGITDAQDPSGAFFGEAQLKQISLRHWGCSAGEIQASIIEAVDNFSSGASQFDDITLMVLSRER